MTMKTDLIFYFFGAYAVLSFFLHILKFGLRKIRLSEYIDKFFFFREKYRITQEKKYLLLFILDVMALVFLIISVIGVIFIY